MRTHTHGVHLQYVFDSFGEFIDYNRANVNRKLDKATRERYAAGDSFSGGLPSVEAACELAATGLQREGIEALSRTATALGARRTIAAPTFAEYWNASGANVDVSRYLTGEPDCMTDYRLTERDVTDSVVTVAINCAVSGGVSPEAIAARGRAVIALIDVIEASARNVELWADMTSKGCNRNMYNHVARISLKLKDASGPTDASAIMYALTHPSFFRVLGFNTRHTFPERWLNALDVGGGYGRTETGTVDVERDYPAGTIYVPAMARNEAPEKAVNEVLDQLSA